MTSPTTSADAVKVLTEIRDEAASNDANCIDPKWIAFWQARVAALDLAIATLPQHAEAGAVAWQVIDKMLVAAYEHGLNGEPMDMMAMQARYAALHPAQPASQQGGKAVEVTGLPGERQFRNAHPAADKVRGLVEKWRSKAQGEHGRGSTGTGMNVCADELAAALDQEKNDGTR